MKTARALAVAAAFALFAAGQLSGCRGDGSEGDADADSDTDTDTDSDADVDGDADGDGGTDADADADGDADGDGGGDADVDGDADGGGGDGGGTCCVVLEGVGDGPVELCEGPPVYGGPTTDAPSIGLSEHGIVLRAGLDRSETRATTLYVQSLEAGGAGEFMNPMVEFWNESGTWFENNATDGVLVIDGWPGVGEQVTGTFSGTPYNMGGDGPEYYAVSGTFCAIRTDDP